MPYLTNKEVQIINFLIKDGIKAFDFRGGFRDCWFTVKESNELANKVEKYQILFSNGIVTNFGMKMKIMTEYTI